MRQTLHLQIAIGTYSLLLPYVTQGYHRMTQKIWLKNYPPGVPEEIDLQVYSSLADFFTQTCQRYKDHTAVSNFGSTLTYQQLEQLSKQFAAYLQQELGLQKGERLAIMLPNVLQYYVAMFGALCAGLVVVNVNPLYTAPELVEELLDAKVETLIVLANFAHTVEKAYERLPLKQVIVTEIGDLFSFPKSWVFNNVARYIKKMVPNYHIPAAISFKHALARGKHMRLQPVDLTQEDVAYLQYTGGTTGTAKGAILTHGNILANIEQATIWVKTSGLKDGEEIIIVPLPLYHIFSLTVCAFCFLKLGGHAVLITNPRDIPQFIKQLARVPYSVLVGINTLFNALLQHPELKQLSFSKLKLVITGGMPLQQVVADNWHKATGNFILEGYGLTEASPIVTVNPTNIKGFNGSIGLPLSSTDVEIRDVATDDRTLALGEEGELCVKGPQVMRGYWNNEAETRQAFTQDGWLKTGDIARLDAEGFVYIVDRKKDMILISGFKVYPNEVEAVLASHPGVREAAVIGVANDVSGEAVKAFVVKKDPALTVESILAFCRERLTRYKIPHQIEFVPGLPKSNVGKILRRELRGK